MGVKKVDRNGPMVLDSQAIWMICSRLDVSMNQRSAATTFKAQLVTETPAIEKDKKSVFENDRTGDRGSCSLYGTTIDILFLTELIA